MTAEGVKMLYTWLTAAWPLVIKPGASEAYQNAKMRELYKTYKEYSDEEVTAAFQKWTEENEKFPTTKNVLNEIKWARRLKMPKGKENAIYWPMDVIYDDGNEWTYGSFKREAFINHPKNPDGIEPEEWERRYKIRRKAIYEKLYPLPDTPQVRHYTELFAEQIARARGAEASFD